MGPQAIVSVETKLLQVGEYVLENGRESLDVRVARDIYKL